MMGGAGSKWWAFRVAALGLLSCFLTGQCRGSSDQVFAEGGVVVEEVGQGSALEKAGVQPGDVLLAWERLPNPPANPQAARGRIESIFDWRWLVEEQAPRGTVNLAGERQGERKVFGVAMGLWEAEVRPRLPGDVLATYLRARERIAAGKLDDAADLWRKRAAVEDDAAWSLRSGMYLRMGEAWAQARQWDQAQAQYHSALKAARDPRSRAAVWDAIGSFYERQGGLEDAVAAYRAALEIRERQVPGSLTEARNLSKLGIVAGKREELDQAAELFQRALEIQEHLAPDSLHVADSLGYLGNVAITRGELDHAAELYRQGLEIRERLAPDSLRLAVDLNNLGVVARDRGDVDQAASLFEGAFQIKEALAVDRLHLAAGLNNLAAVSVDRGDLARATELERRALMIREQLASDSLAVARSLNNLGVIAQRGGDLARAEELHRRALEIREQRVPGGLDVAVSLNNLALVAWDRGDLVRAAELDRRALEIQEQRAPGSLNVATSLDQLGRVAQARGDLAGAVKLHQRALGIRQQLAPGSSAEADTLASLAAVHRGAHRPGEALKLYLRSIDALEKQIGKLGGSETIFRAQHGDKFRSTIELLLQLNRPEEAFAILERSRARSFLNLLAKRDLLFGADIPEELDRTRRRLAALHDRTLYQLTGLSPARAPEQVEALRERLQELRRQYDDNTEQIRRASPRLAALRYPKSLDLRGAREALDPGTALLSFSVGEEHTYLFVLGRDRVLRVESLDASAGEIRREVEQLRLLISEAKSSSSIGILRQADLEEASLILYETLIHPAADALESSERVLIIPDGPLHMLPFAALKRPDGTFLAEWKPLHLVLSVTVYAELRKSAVRPRSLGAAEQRVFLRAFGDPQYPESFAQAPMEEIPDVRVRSAVERDLLRWTPLPFTRQEVGQIAALYPPEASFSYLGEDATEERAKLSADGARIIHFALHGHTDDRFPLSSGLAFTIPEEFSKGRDNGLLQAWEIFEDLRLEADLVVLSACQTGLGELQDGEGLIGLTRAFQYAGARTVAASLWSVADRATAELMVRFHRHLRAGSPKDEALRAAQLELIRGPIEIAGETGEPEAVDWATPYYWAAFQIYGDWQ